MIDVGSELLHIALIAREASLWMDGPAPRTGLNLGVVLIETPALILIAWRKTEGEWKWRWGGGERFVDPGRCD